jgi:GNAT superfamily N-acetyltransferase
MDAETQQPSPRAATLAAVALVEETFRQFDEGCLTGDDVVQYRDLREAVAGLIAMIKARGAFPVHPPGTVLTIEVGGLPLATAPVPACDFIGRGPGTERLYRAEHKVADAIMEAAVVRARLEGWGSTEGHPDFYSKAVPSALLQALETFAPTAGVAAAVGYLAYHGIAVDLPAAAVEEKDAQA